MQHTATPERWQRLRRFFTWQLDPEHHTITMTAIPAMRAFTKPVMLVWGAKDENFGPAIANRLVRDIPGAVGIRWMQKSAHMPMMEEPEDYAATVEGFLQDRLPASDFASAADIRAAKP
jgi:pimeloyl-ACP methyl ester carboxylesterase